ncbi:DUF4124 domain-containing protein [Ningiella sp. W23]|uniref:DUF4124 domain-containing protein n=1 Tax=Ningiella sp. W23 TaxID=3023715 RepID=UPI003756934E
MRIVSGLITLSAYFVATLICLSVDTYALANDKIYKIVNADGSITFSDKPANGATEVELSGNTANVQALVAVPQASTSAPQNEPAIKYQLLITSPEPEATIRDNSGNVSISAKITPSANGTYRLTFAGTEYRSTSGVFSLTDINRGEHKYKVSFIDNSGKLIASSEQRTLYLHQASILIRPSVN